MSKTDTGNQRQYALIPDIIRDFCNDAIRSGRVPTDEEVENLVGEYAVEGLSLIPHCGALIVHEDDVPEFTRARAISMERETWKREI